MYSALAILESPSKIMVQPEQDRYPPEEAQRRFEALIRAARDTPPLQRKDIPRQRPVSKRKAKKGDLAEEGGKADTSGH